MRVLVVLLLVLVLPGTEHLVRGPLAQVLKAPIGCGSVALTVPAEAPADLGALPWLRDRHGRWWQGAWQALRPGVQVVSLVAPEQAGLVAEPLPLGIDAALRDGGLRRGVVLATASATPVRLGVEWSVAGQQASTASVCEGPTVQDWDCPRQDAEGFHAQTGQLWSGSLRPQPFPIEPFDPEAFRAEMIVTGMDGAVQRLPLFLHQPCRLRDAGDREEAQPFGLARYAWRWRPARAGQYAVALSARWGDGRELRRELPPLHVVGDTWDDIVRADPEHPGQLVLGLRSGVARRWWPIGLNLHTVWDQRCRNRTATRLTPDRGWHAYEAYLQRCAAAGIDAVEVWLASWNLALEWRADWGGHGGLGRYHAGNAERIDRLLDLAEQLGIRVLLVLNNHGQASDGVDTEWKDNPYNAHLRRPAEGVLSGPAQDPDAFFSNPAALAAQDRLRGYLVARWGGHPALLGWKLCTEIDLTSASPAILAGWHQHVASHLASADGSSHLVATHWSGDWRRPWPHIARQPGLSLLTIDAYHGNDPDRLLCDVLWEGLHEPGDNVSIYAKPVLITECGGSSEAASPPRLAAEQAAAPWASWIAGYAGGAMLWWHEYVDQQQRWGPYSALRAFLRVAGADRRVALRSRRLRTSDDIRLWAACRFGEGVLTAWCADRQWLAGGSAEPVREATLLVGSSIAAGTLRAEWWGCDRPGIAATVDIQHPGGELTLTMPEFIGHCALLLRRE